jgi:hypothetical protein
MMRAGTLQRSLFRLPTMTMLLSWSTSKSTIPLHTTIIIMNMLTSTITITISTITVRLHSSLLRLRIVGRTPTVSGLRSKRRSSPVNHRHEAQARRATGRRIRVAVVNNERGKRISKPCLWIR